MQTRTPPLILNCWQTEILHGITHQCWISHSQYSSNANMRIAPLAMGWPCFWKRSVQIPCLVTPTCPSFHFPLPPRSVPFPFLFQWPPSTHPSTPYLAWETTPVALPRHQHHILCLHQNALFWWPRWLYLNSLKWLGLVHFVPCDAEMALQCYISLCKHRFTEYMTHKLIQFFFFLHRVPLLDLKTRISLSKSSNPLGEGLGRVLEIWLTEDSSWTQMKYFTQM